MSRIKKANARAQAITTDLQGKVDTKLIATSHHELGDHVTDGHLLYTTRFPRGIKITVFYRPSDGLHVNWHGVPQSGDARYYIATAQPAFIKELHEYLEIVHKEGRPNALTVYK